MSFPRKFVVPLLLLAFSAAMAILSPGFFEADEISHYLKARAIFHNWHAVLDIWGRPACTGLFGLASAVGGLIGARLLAVLITALTAAGTLQLWKQLALDSPQAPRPSSLQPESFLILLLYAQPLFLMNTFAVMTELLLACSWIWAAVFLARRRTLLAGLILGLGGLARPEGWFAIALWPIVLLLWNRLTPALHNPRPAKTWSLIIVHWSFAAAAAFLPLLAWYLAGTLAYHDPAWPAAQFPWHAASQYGPTGLFFLGSALISLALWMWLPIAHCLLHLRRTRNPAALLLVATPFLSFYALHGFMGTFGLMGSMSLPRYFVAVAPFAAILALVGLQHLESRTRHPALLRKATLLLILLPLATLIAFGQLPTSKTTDMLRLDVAIDAFRQRVPESDWPTQLIAEHPYIFYSLGISLDAPAHMRIFDRAAIASAPAGTMIITDTKIWAYEHRPTPAELRAMGYLPDLEVARAITQVPAKLDLTTLGPTSNPVALWIKQSPAPAETPSSQK